MTITICEHCGRILTRKANVVQDEKSELQWSELHTFNLERPELLVDESMCPLCEEGLEAVSEEQPRSVGRSRKGVKS